MNERIRELYIQTSNETADGKEWAIGGMKNAERFADLVRDDTLEEVANWIETSIDMKGINDDPYLSKYTLELLLGIASSIRAMKGLK